jgi:hypothetical protein
MSSLSDASPAQQLFHHYLIAKKEVDELEVITYIIIIF